MPQDGLVLRLLGADARLFVRSLRRRDLAWLLLGGGVLIAYASLSIGGRISGSWSADLLGRMSGAAFEAEVMAALRLIPGRGSLRQNVSASEMR
jgi:hypothetical protein